jgi:hypothetical protein
VSLIIIGGGYSQEDVDKIQAAADGVKPLAIFWADVSKTVGQGRPTPDAIKDRILGSIGDEEKDGAWTPGIHRY